MGGRGWRGLPKKPNIFYAEFGRGAERDRNPFCRLIENFCSGLRSGTSTAGGPRLQLSSCTAPPPGGAGRAPAGVTGGGGGGGGQPLRVVHGYSYHHARHPHPVARAGAMKV